MNASKTGNRRRAVFVVTACAVLVGLSTGVTASAAPERTRTAAQEKSANPASLIPATDESVTGPGIPAGVAYGTRAKRAKLTISIEDKVAFAYPFNSAIYGTPFEVNGKKYASTQLVPAERLPARPDPTCNYIEADFVIPLWAVDVDNSRQRFRSVGHVADTRVSVLAFGALPVVATLRLRQLIIAGQSEPLLVRNPALLYSVRKDDPRGFDGQTGCDPQWEQEVSPATIVNGRVEAFVTDVRIDGAPLDVGDSCRSAKPIDLHLVQTDGAHGGTGYDPNDGGTLVQALDRRNSGSSNPTAFFPGSRNLTIPPFVGCRGAAGEDVSRLITNAVSGPGNTLAVTQAKAFTEASGSTQNPRTCTPEGVCAQQPVAPRPPVPGK